MARQPSRRFLISGVLAVAAVAIAGAALVLILRGGESGAAPTAPAERAAPAVPVTAATVNAMTLEETVRGIGTLRAAAVVDLRPELAGRIRRIHFEEGGMVEEGQLLIEIDDEKLQRQLAARQAALRAAEVREANAGRVFERQQQLREQGFVSEEEYDRVRSELEGARAERDRLEAEVSLTMEQMRDARLEAPFSGMISQRLVDRGNYVAIGDSLARLYQTDPLEIEFAVPERYMGRVQRGQTVRVVVSAWPDRTFEGTVDFISPAVEETTRSFSVKASIPNPDGRLMPGAFATAVVTVGRREQRPVVPEEALVATRMGYMVFVIEEDHARSQVIETGLRREGLVEVVGGLDIGEQVVRSGHLRLSGGERVEIVEGNDEARMTNDE